MVATPRWMHEVEPTLSQLRPEPLKCNLRCNLRAATSSTLCPSPPGATRPRAQTTPAACRCVINLLLVGSWGAALGGAPAAAPSTVLAAHLVLSQARACNRHGARPTACRHTRHPAALRAAAAAHAGGWPKAAGWGCGFVARFFGAMRPRNTLSERAPGAEILPSALAEVAPPPAGPRPSGGRKKREGAPPALNAGRAPELALQRTRMPSAPPAAALAGGGGPRCAPRSRASTPRPPKPNNGLRALPCPRPSPRRRGPRPPAGPRGGRHAGTVRPSYGRGARDPARVVCVWGGGGGGGVIESHCPTTQHWLLV